MILTLVALIAVTAISAWLAANSKRGSFFGGVVAPLFVLIGLVLLFVYGVVVTAYIGAGYKADIINREYGTNYTQAEVFYASSAIDTIRELDRKRVEINGDLITGK